MKMQFSFRKILNWKVIIILLFPLQWFFFTLIRDYPQFIEKWYSEGIFKYLSFLQRLVFGWIPFSFGEALLYLIILLLLYLVVLRVVQLFRGRIKIKVFLFRTLIASMLWLSIVYFLFMIFWGLNYHREPLVSFHNTENYKSGKTFDEHSFTSDDLRGLCEELIIQTNQSRLIAMDQDRNSEVFNLPDDEIIQKASTGFQNIYIENKKWDYRIPSVKKILFTDVFSYLGVGGIYNPFTGEANVNMDPPNFLLPATVCHEMAHQAGIAPEDEASYMAYIVCKSHPSPFFNYSGNFMALRYVMSSLRRYDRNAYRELWEKISDEIKIDMDENRKYWNRFKNPFEKYSDRVYDQYLKANAQQAGIQSYSHIVQLLLIDFKERKKTIINTP